MIKSGLFKEVIMIGDKVLIKPKQPLEQTTTGLYLPPSIQEKEKIKQGYVVKVGPGYPIPTLPEPKEPWQEPSETVKYIPVQPKAGDLALFLSKQAFEIYYQGENYYIVPQSAILMLERPTDFVE